MRSSLMCIAHLCCCSGGGAAKDSGAGKDNDSDSDEDDADKKKLEGQLSGEISGFSHHSCLSVKM